MMSYKSVPYKSVLALVGAITVTACGQSEPIGLRPAATTPLPDSKITLDGEDYVLKRASVLEGRRKGQEGWAIVVDGKSYGCAAPNEVSCMAALNRAKRGGRTDEDRAGMGY